MKKGLIIFIRNPVVGKVKTRIAQTMGDDNAMEVYRLLLEHTRSITVEVSCDKFLFYSDRINHSDEWENEIYDKRLQQAGDLGQRMAAAFSELFTEGYQQVLIIGSDCIELTAAGIQEAFELLNQHSAVIGPATDGGYYLLGITRFFPQPFLGKKWGTGTVLQDTLDDFRLAGVNIGRLPVLNDVDEEKDIPAWMIQQLAAKK